MNFLLQSNYSIVYNTTEDHLDQYILQIQTHLVEMCILALHEHRNLKPNSRYQIGLSVQSFPCFHFHTIISSGKTTKKYINEKKNFR